jgi:hypothetical protein
MKRAWILCVAIAVLAVPSVASASVSPTDYKNAAKFCKALRTDMGPTLFKQTYGTNKNKSNAFGKCVSKNAHTVDEIHSDAVQQCKAERTADPAAFSAKYGSSNKPDNGHGNSQGNDRNALGKCVSQKQRQLRSDKHDAIENAAQTCKTERNADRAAFAEKYGTNENNRNAFGKCVSKTVRTEEQTTQS